jgi:hypothetical protein
MSATGKIVFIVVKELNKKAGDRGLRLLAARKIGLIVLKLLPKIIGIRVSF